MPRHVDELEIELLRPNETAFGAAGSGGFVDVGDDEIGDVFDDEPHPRWTMAIAGLLVTGLLAAGVIAAAPWSNDTAATPPTSTTTPPTSTTTPAPHTTVPSNPLAGIPTTPVGWVATPPTDSDWVFGGAGSNDIGQGFSGERVDVWAQRDTARDTGPWLVVRSSPYNQGSLVEGGIRTTFGDRSAVVSTGTDGVTRLTVSVGPPGGPDTTTLIFESLGLGLDQLAPLAASVTPPNGFENEPILYGDLRSRSGVLGLPLRYSGSPAFAGAGLGPGIPDASTSYWSATGGSIEVARRPWDPEFTSVAPLLLTPMAVPPQLQPIVDDLSRMGRDVSVFTSVDQPDVGIVSWHQDDLLLSLTGYRAPLEVLLTMARNARPATDAEWIDLLTQTQQGIQFSAADDSPSMFQNGQFENGTVWQGTLSDEWFWINSDNAGWYGTVTAGDTASVHRYAGTDVTVIIGIDPSGLAATMRVTAADAEPVLIDMDSLGPATAAFHLMSVDVPVQVDLLDATGAVVPVAPTTG